MPNYKYLQESAGSGRINCNDNADEHNLTNELRQIVEDLAYLLGHSKLGDGLYPKSGPFGGILSKLNSGLEASKPADPAVGDMYLATDTLKIYRSFTAGNWTQVYPFGGFTNQILTSSASISWDMEDGNRATLIAAHNFTIKITKFTGVLKAILIITQDGTGSRVMDEIVTQKDDSIATTDVHIDTEIIDIGIDIPTGARIRFKTSDADLPDPLIVDTIYYAIRVSATEIKVAINKADAFASTAIDLTDTGTGTHEVQQLVKWPGGILGVLQTATGGEDIVKLHYKSSDEQWYAELVSNFS